MATLNRVVTRIEAYDGQPTSPLRTLRALKNLSGAELARLADVDRATVRRLEFGITTPQGRTARKIAAVLGCPVDLLFPPNDVETAANGLDGKAAGDDGAYVNTG